MKITNLNLSTDAKLVGWWKLDDGTVNQVAESGESVLDSNSIIAHNGIIVGNPKWINGKIGKALEFNPDDLDASGNPIVDYIKIPFAGITGDNPRTVSAWIKPTKSNATILTWGTGGDNKKWRFRVESFEKSIRLEIDGSSKIVSKTAVQHQAPGQVWHHVAATFKGDTLDDVNIYIDGEKETDLEKTNPDDKIETAANTNGLFIGIGLAGVDGEYSYPFGGVIDDVRIYNDALTDTEIQELYSYDGKVTITEYQGETLPTNVPYVIQSVLVQDASTIVIESPDVVITTSGTSQKYTLIQDSNIGSSTEGNYSLTGNEIIVIGGGTNKNNHYYVYRKFYGSGDFEVSCDISSLTGFTTTNSSVGLMIRDSLKDDNTQKIIHARLKLEDETHYKPQIYELPGGDTNSDSIDLNPSPLPLKIKIQRVNGVYKVWVPTDSTTDRDSDKTITIEGLKNDVYIGFATISKTNTTFNTTFNNLFFGTTQWAQMTETFQVNNTATISVNDAITLGNKLIGTGSLEITGYNGQDLSLSHLQLSNNISYFVVQEGGTITQSIPKDYIIVNTTATISGADAKILGAKLVGTGILTITDYQGETLPTNVSYVIQSVLVSGGEMTFNGRYKNGTTTITPLSLALFNQQSVGNANEGSSFTRNSNRFTINTQAPAYWLSSTSSNFNYVYTKLIGTDAFDITVRLNSMSRLKEWQKGGLMIRKNQNDGQQPYIFTLVEHDNTVGKYNSRITKFHSSTGIKSIQYVSGDLGEWDNSSVVYFKISRNNVGVYTIYKPSLEEKPGVIPTFEVGDATGHNDNAWNDDDLKGEVFIGFATTTGSISSGNTEAIFDIIEFNIYGSMGIEFKVNTTATISVEDAITLGDKLTVSGSLEITGYDGSQDISSINVEINGVFKVPDNTTIPQTIIDNKTFIIVNTTANITGAVLGTSGNKLAGPGVLTITDYQGQTLPTNVTWVIQSVLANDTTISINTDSYRSRPPPRWESLKLWLKADTGISVNKWLDQSENNNHANLIGTLPAQSNQLNSLNVMTYDGVNAYHEFTRIVDIRTVFWVVAFTPHNQHTFLLGDSSKWHFHATETDIFWNSIHLHPAIRNGDLWLNGTEQTSRLGIKKPAVMTLITLKCTDDKRGADNSWNGTPETVWATNFSRDRTSARYFKGDLAELLIYNEPLTDNEIKIVEAYLGWKWGIKKDSNLLLPEFKVNTTATISVNDALTLGDKLRGDGSLQLTGYTGQDLASITFSHNITTTIITENSTIKQTIIDNYYINVNTTANITGAVLGTSGNKLYGDGILTITDYQGQTLPSNVKWVIQSIIVQDNSTITIEDTNLVIKDSNEPHAQLSRTRISTFLVTTSEATIIDSTVQHGDFVVTKVFDGDLTTSGNNRFIVLQTNLPAYIIWKFENPFRVVDYKLMIDHYNWAPKNFKLLGSNDTNAPRNWTVVDTVTDESGWSMNQIRSYSVDNHGYYSYYKFLISAAVVTTGVYIGLREIQLYETPPGVPEVKVNNTAIISINDALTLGDKLTVTGQLHITGMAANINYSSINNIDNILNNITVQGIFPYPPPLPISMGLNEYIYKNLWGDIRLGSEGSIYTGNGYLAYNEVKKNVLFDEIIDFYGTDINTRSGGVTGTNQFGVVWDGYILVGGNSVFSAGKISFGTRSDDGSVVWVDNQLVVGNFGDHPQTNKTGFITLTEGYYRFTVGWYEGGGGEYMGVKWKQGEETNYDNMTFINATSANSFFRTMPSLSTITFLADPSTDIYNKVKHYYNEDPTFITTPQDLRSLTIKSNSSITLNSNMTITGTLTIESKAVLVITRNGTLTINSGAEMKISKTGAFICQGKFINSGTLSSLN